MNPILEHTLSALRSLPRVLHVPPLVTRKPKRGALPRNVVRAFVNRVMRRRAKKGYDCNPVAVAIRYIDRS